MRRRFAIVVALGLTLAACGSGGEEESGPAQPVELRSANPAAGCGPVVRFPLEGRSHIQTGTVVNYRTKPPTSGDHNQIWGATGTYVKEIPDEVQVHNLEHGHVLIQYVPGKIDAALLDGLVKLTRANERFVLLAPRSAGRFVPEAALAFTTWLTAQTCATPASSAIGEATSFVKRYQKKAPEEVPGDPKRETPPRS